MDQHELDRRSLLITSLLMATATGCGSEAQRPGFSETPGTPADLPDPNQTFFLPYEKVTFTAWGEPAPAQR